MRLMNRIIRKKINNKGNTLGVVVIGILLLGILGTLILNITAANYQMKLADNQSKRNFYYVEKAVDEIYAGIGVEAMAAVSDAYQYVLSNVVKNDDNRLAALSGDEAKEVFARQYFDILNDRYINNPISVEDQLSILKGYIGAVDRVTFNVEPVYDNDGTTLLTDISYDNTEQKLTFKDIKVNSRTASGFNVSVTTDFVVTLPDVNLSFADSGSNNFEELSKFALVIDGYETLKKKVNDGSVDFDSLLQTTQNKILDNNIASMTVSKSNSTVNLIGNVYVGTSSVSRKKSVDIRNSGIKFNVNAKNFICGGSVVLSNAEVIFNGLSAMNGVDLVRYGLLDSENQSLGMHLWANNLVTDGKISSNLVVNGDCFVADDLEVNGDNSTVRMNGNYFGYGYAGSTSNKAVEANSLDRTIFDISNNLPEDYVYDHEGRSAIMINGKNADVILAPVDSFDMVILGGRAYIDLETGAGSLTSSPGNSTYMTGESVSFKGNQNLYKADIEELGSIVESNPVSFDSISSYVTGDNLNYTALGIDSTKIIAKRVGSSVYFYRYTNNPTEQTNYFLERVRSNFVRPSIEAQVRDLGVQNLRLDHDNRNIYTAGAVTEIEGGVLLNSRLGNGVTNGTLDSGFLNLIEEMKYRYDSISSDLTEYGEAYGDLSNMNEAPSSTTVYSHFVDEDLLDELLQERGLVRYEAQNIEEKPGIGTAGEDICELLFGSRSTGGEVNLGVTIMNNAHRGGDVLQTERSYGIIVATGDVRITKDFTGVILCGGNLTIDEGVTVTACPALFEFLATYDEVLNQLFGFSAGSGDVSEIKTRNTDYQNLVSMENWRKN